MKLLFIIRHAKAEQAGIGMKDFDRVLTASGKTDAKAMAENLFAKTNVGIGSDLSQHLFLSSPAKRAVQTAEIFAQVFKIKNEEIQKEQEIYDAYSEFDLISILKSLPDNLETVFLFGHNPNLTNLANYCSDEYEYDLPTCSIARIEINATSWKEFDKKNATWTNFWVPKKV